MPAFKDITNQKFGLLTAIEFLGNGRWRCVCECGGESTPRVSALRNGNTKSCGCRKRAVLGESTTKHGRVGDPEYQSWAGMKSRCLNPKVSAYKNYGGRGIKVCERWMVFENFLADMGERPDDTTLDRINNDGNYEPGNCRWASVIEQGLNTSTTRKITHNGVTKSLSGWARQAGKPASWLHKRLKRMPFEEAMKGYL